MQMIFVCVCHRLAVSIEGLNTQNLPDEEFEVKLSELKLGQREENRALKSIDDVDFDFFVQFLRI